MLFLKQPLIVPFLCHKLATACQIDSNKISNSKWKLNLQLLHSSHTNGIQFFLGHPVDISSYGYCTDLTCWGDEICFVRGNPCLLPCSWLKLMKSSALELKLWQVHEP